MRGDSASGLLVVFVLGFLFGWFLFAFWGLLVFFSPHHVVFPFPSMMTWALRPHGVRTRGKKRVGEACTLEHPVKGNIDLGVEAGCPQMDHEDLSLQSRPIRSKSTLA